MKRSELTKLVTAVLLTTFADRLAQLQLLSFVVLSGPSGEGSGSSAFALLLPSVVFGFLAGSIADKTNRRLGILYSTVARGVIVVAVPTLIALFGASGFTIALSLAVLNTCTTLFSVEVFSITPDYFARPNAMRLKQANAAIWMAVLIGSLLAILLSNLASEQMIPADSLRACFAIYCFGAFILWSLRSLPKCSKSQGSASDFVETFKYLARHKRVLNFIRLSTVTTFAASIWLTSAIALSMENFLLTGIDLRQLLGYLSVGMIGGALLAVTWLKSLPAEKLLYTGCLLLILMSALLAFSFNLRVEVASISLLGAASSMVLIASDSFLQAMTPRKVRGRVVGIRNVLVSGAILIFIVVLEQFVVHLSGLAVTRILAVASLCSSLLLLCFWPELGSFAANQVWFRLRRKLAGYKFDGAHQLSARGSQIYVMDTCSLADALEISSAFSRPIKLIVAQAAVPPFSDYILERSQATRVSKSGTPAQTMHRFLNRGYSVCIRLDTGDKKTELLKDIAQVRNTGKFKIVPINIERTSGAILIKFGIPIDGETKLSAEKLAQLLPGNENKPLETTR